MESVVGSEFSVLVVVVGGVNNDIRVSLSIKRINSLTLCLSFVDNSFVERLFTFPVVSLRVNRKASIFRYVLKNNHSIDDDGLVP